MAKDEIELLSVDAGDEKPVKKEKKQDKKKEKKDNKEKKEKKTIVVDDAKKYKKVIYILGGIIVLLLVVFALKPFNNSKNSLTSKQKEKYANLYIDTLKDNLDLENNYNILLVDFNDDVIPELVVRYGKFAFRLYTIRDDEVAEIQSFHIDGEYSEDEELGEYQLFYDRKKDKLAWFFLYGGVYYDMKDIIDRDLPYPRYYSIYDINKDYMPMDAKILSEAIDNTNVNDVVKSIMGKDNYEAKYTLKEAKKVAKDKVPHKLICSNKNERIDGHTISYEYIYIMDEFVEYYYKIHYSKEEYDDANIDGDAASYNFSFNYRPTTYSIDRDEDGSYFIAYLYNKVDFCAAIGGCDETNIEYSHIDDYIDRFNADGQNCEIK